MQIASLTLLLTGPVSWLITCGFSKSRECWLKMACSAAADMSKRPFLTYDACSLARLSAVRPVSPIYSFSQSLHFRRYHRQARSQGIRKGVTFCGGSGGAPQKNFKFKVANTPNFNDFLQLPKKFRMSKYLLLLTEMPDLLQGAFRETVFNALNIWNTWVLFVAVM